MSGSRLGRVLRHLAAPPWAVRRAFPHAALSAIEAAIRESERHHRAELRFAAEAGLDLMPVWQGETARQRAVEVFSDLRVWDTAENSGVLIYVQLVDRKVEILADRGINARVAQGEWEDICREMERAFRRGDFEAGAIAAIRRIGALLAAHFPSRPDNPNELPDRPVLL
ncbi:MAG: hypothetical protein E6R11_04980 [Rhodocyclaceae bacterium]|nr:MAG: hypothetical protein E6R11_04980 [Rhodocyclaceae bacterium]